MHQLNLFVGQIAKQFRIDGVRLSAKSETFVCPPLKMARDINCLFCQL